MRIPPFPKRARLLAIGVLVAVLAALTIPAAPASGQETGAAIDIETDIIIAREPVTGLADVVVDLDLSGAGQPGGSTPAPPADPDAPPTVEVPFCLYVPPTGLSLTITSDNADVNGGFFIVSEDGAHRIEYVVELASDDPDFPQLGPFRSGEAKFIPQTSANSSTDCDSLEDNAGLVVDFAQGASFRTVLLAELEPGLTYVFRDVLVLNVSFYF